MHIMKLLMSLLVLLMVTAACNDSKDPVESSTVAGSVETPAEPAADVDDMSAKNVVQVAIGSKDHSTLVKAVTAAELADDLSTTGPFTVFAPTNAAFEKLPTGTVDELLTAAKKDDLINILQYHVSVGVYKAESFQDGQSIGQVNGDNIIISKKDGKTFVNGNAVIIASIPASNGIIHVIDGVLLPAAKK